RIEAAYVCMRLSTKGVEGATDQDFAVRLDREAGYVSATRRVKAGIRRAVWKKSCKVHVRCPADIRKMAARNDLSVGLHCKGVDKGSRYLRIKFVSNGLIEDQTGD